ncbi:MAG TPA: NAD-dependent epimerase/dehydratase family protein [Candidatus Paceibacterota bacterium]
MTQKKGKKILIIGGTGFIGSVLVDVLDLHEEASVSVVHSQPLKEVIPSRALYYRLSAEEPALEGLMAAHDVVVVLIRPHKKAMQNIASAIKKAQPKHVIYASTSLLYGDLDSAQAEDARLDPITPHEHSKFEEERLLKTAAKNKTVLTIARLGSVYGDRHSNGIISRAFHALFRDEPIEARSLSSVRDYIHVDDVAQALAALALGSPRQHEIINISGGVGADLEKVLHLIEGVAGTSIRRIKGRHIKESQQIIADNKKYVKRLGGPTLDLKAGLEKTYERFRSWYDRRT